MMGMVKRTRFRAILMPLALYCVSGAAVGYFTWHAVNGDRGLKARAEYERRGREKANWQTRIALMRSDAVDRDLLEEEARHLLGRVGRNDLVIYLDPERR